MLSFIRNTLNRIRRKIFKRRKTDIEEEAIVECRDDTKIRINHYALENYHESSSGMENHDITGVHDYGNEMRANSEIEDILERPDTVIMQEPDNVILGEPDKDYDYSP